MAKYNTEELRQRSTALNTGSTDLQNLITNLHGQVSELMMGWEGSAGAQFDATYQQFTSAATSVQEALGSIARTLGQAADVYDETEAAVKGAFVA